MKKIWIIESCADCFNNLKCSQTLPSYKEKVKKAIKNNLAIDFHDIPKECPLETYKE